MSTSETAFENALDDLIEALKDIARKRMLSPIAVNQMLHIVAHAADHTMLGVMGSKDTERQGEDQNERSSNN
jgi:hypothetical protein